ncbi:MAG: IPTL-CTERM sorting domain-containing protein, partial [Phycisphaerae bacterium]
RTTEIDCLTNNNLICTPGIYQGDNVPCTPSPCDCNGNGVPDGEDIASGTSEDCDDDGTPDECEFPPPDTVGRCCIPGTGCATTDPATCSAAGGFFDDFCTSCDVQSIAIIVEPGGDIFIHAIGPPVDCDPPPPGPCPPNAPLIDPWKSPPSGAMCHNFGSAAVTPIPAGFFGAGSDPFNGTVCFVGVPLGDPNFPDADTLIQRSADPFDRCDLPSPMPSTVDIEIVALNLASTNPITVTFFGGQNPELWDVAVDLSTAPPPPPGQLTAVKEHCNGGTYTSILNVQPKFTFTNPNTGAQQVFDTGLIMPVPDPPIQLQQLNPAPWVHDLAPQIGIGSDPCSDFHPGVVEKNPNADCDCNGNNVRDKCDIEMGAPDADADGIPDECQAGNPIPTLSQWGITVMTLLLLAGGTIVFRVRRTATT